MVTDNTRLLLGDHLCLKDPSLPICESKHVITRPDFFPHCFWKSVSLEQGAVGASWVSEVLKVPYKKDDRIYCSLCHISLSTPSSFYY